ncbi:coiled-coil domain-containing protein 1-like [Papaver somniferum]|uniref:coiled-coil domain-containing protein 1-like n=1 Tax=Papaver somniferum TaxID=3469 RepID=UPI000E7017B7|nr:coiled-coil domain-containing protein 1-like [Papaver somniferum]
MVTSSSSDYDYYYSSNSSDEDSQSFVAKSRAKMNHAKRAKPSTPLNDQRVTYDEIMKRKSEDDRIDDRQRRKDQTRRTVLATEEKLRSQADGVPSESDASEDEPVWVPRDRKMNPDRHTREIREIMKQVEDDLAAERKEEDDWDSSDPNILPDFVNGPDNDSDEEEDSEKDDDDDSERSDDSDESDD